MSRLCYKNMFMKDHSSFVSCIQSFTLPAISETSIVGFYYLSIWVVTKRAFINRLAVYMSTLFYCLRSVLLRKLKIKGEREIFSSRGHCFSLCLSFWKLGKRKRFLLTVLGVFLLFKKIFILISSLGKSAM